MIFGKWKKNKPEATPPAEAQPAESGPLLSFVMMRDTQSPSLQALTAAVKKRIPGFETVEEDNQPDGPLTGIVAGKLCAILIIDQPNPINADDSFITSAWWWPEAAEALEQQRSHAIVTVMGADDPKTGSALLAQLSAAVIDATDAIGVIWNAADAVWQADMFQATVDESDDGLPMFILFSTKLSRDTEYPRADGSPAWLCLTYGLGAFGLMEVEVRGFDGDTPEELIETVSNIGAYLIDAGPVIDDGHTVGPDEHTKVTVRHEPSTLNPGAMVYRLYLSVPNEAV